MWDFIGILAFFVLLMMAVAGLFWWVLLRWSGTKSPEQED
jgi:hypothetical protein